MFGQPMPEGVVGAAAAAIASADLLLVVGSTLLVQPANELPAVALRHGTPIVVINPHDESPYDAYSAGLVRAKAGEFLAEVAEVLNAR